MNEEYENRNLENNSEDILKKYIDSVPKVELSDKNLDFLISNAVQKNRELYSDKKKDINIDKKVFYMKSWQKLSIAASILFIIGTGYFFVFQDFFELNEKDAVLATKSLLHQIKSIDSIIIANAQKEDKINENEKIEPDQDIALEYKSSSLKSIDLEKLLRNNGQLGYAESLTSKEEFIEFFIETLQKRNINIKMKNENKYTSSWFYVKTESVDSVVKYRLLLNISKKSILKIELLKSDSKILNDKKYKTLNKQALNKLLKELSDL
jgi:hypothetical protein